MELNDIRKDIDLVDQELLSLFLKRMGLSEQVSAYKRENSLPVVNRERERAILARVSREAGEYEEYAYRFFTRIMDLSKMRQGELNCGGSAVETLLDEALKNAAERFPRTGMIACQGVEGGNSQQACDKLLPRGELMYVKTFEAVGRAVESGLCDFGVLPIENNSNGSVRAVYELLQKKHFYIVRSITMDIRHQLMAKPGTALSDIRTIYSHEQALGQCSEYLAGLSDARLFPCGNTAEAAKTVAESRDKTVACVASSDCAELYGLEILAKDIQDRENNRTKFICIAKKPAIYAGADRLSLILSCPDRPGALSEILEMLAVRGINMSKLESCPVPGRSFEYLFYMELCADPRDPGVRSLLAGLELDCDSFSFLGGYSAL